MTIARSIVRGITRSIVRNLDELFGGFSAYLSLNSMGQITSTPTASTELSNASTSTATVTDFEGIVRDTLAGEVRVKGGRRVENHVVTTYVQPLNSPNDLTGALTARATIAYSSANDESTVTVTDASGDSVVRYAKKLSQAIFTANDTIVVSAKVKGVGASIGKKVFVTTGSVGDAGPEASVTLTGEFQLISATRTKANSNGDYDYIVLRVTTKATLAEGDQVIVKNLQTELINGQTNQAASSFVNDVSGLVNYDYESANTVDGSGIVTEAKGALISPAPTTLHEGAATNSMPFSWDLTNAAWTETGTAVVALDAVGMNGAANNACTLTDDDGAAHEYTVEAITIADDSNTHVVRLFVTKDTDETRFPSVGIAYSVGTTVVSYDLDFNTKTGAAVVRTAGTGAAYEVNTYAGQWEILISLPNNTTGNTTATVTVWPSVGTVIGTAAVAATGSIIVGNVEIHLNKTIAEVKGTTPIFTNSAPVSRAVDQLQISDLASWWNQDAGVLLFKNTFRYDSAAESTDQGLVTAVESSLGLLRFVKNDDGRLQSRAGGDTNLQDAPFTNGTVAIFAVIWSTPLNSLSLGRSDDGGVTWFAWDSTTYGGAWAIGTKLNLFLDNPHINNLGGVQLFDKLPADTLLDSQDYIEANAAGLLS